MKNNKKGQHTMTNEIMTNEQRIEEFNNMNKYQKLFAFGVIERKKEHEDKLKPIYEYFNKGNDRVQEIYWISDEFQIAEVSMKRTSHDILYVAFVKYQTTNKWARTIDEALIMALAHKHDGDNSAAPEYISRMLNIEYQE